MLESFVHKWADHASVAGICISVIGFVVTFIGLLRSRNAAQRAADAVSDVRQKLSLRGAVVDLSRVVADVDELKSLHRTGTWQLLPQRYAALRRQLLALKENYPSLSRAQKSSIQGIIQQFSSIEDVVEVALAAGGVPQDIPGLNKIATEQGDKLHSILVKVQQEIGS